MLKKIIQRAVKKIGTKKFLFMVLEACARATKNKEDDKLIADIKKLLDEKDGE